MKLLTGRTHFSKKKIIKLSKEKAPTEFTELKPRGFWYQLDNCLFQWGGLFFGKYVYDVQIDEKYFISIFDIPKPNKILRISEFNELKEFFETYKKNKIIHLLKNVKYHFEYIDLNFNIEDIPSRFRDDVIAINFVNSFSSGDRDRVITISSTEEFEEFIDNYAVRKVEKGFIDWERVSQDYAGIEIVNFDKLMKRLDKIKNEEYQNFKNIFGTFDFSSGCIWYPIMVEIKYLGELDEFEIPTNNGKRC